MKKFKTLCEIKPKDFEAYKTEIKAFIINPKFICKKCLLVSNDKDKLCKPEIL